ncbi:MAG: DUF429 domain-containing protein [Afipia sp.]|nr:DUF429 domain-containing protein [Afipia sp.]
MKIIGIDFTSRPTNRKPITCVRCSLKENLLSVETLELWPSFTPFEEALVTPGPWIAGIDFPFGQSRKFIENIGWPRSWAHYVRHANELGRDEFCKALDNYRQPRAWRDKEHQRKTDTAAGSISPQKLYGVPVGLMFFEGAHRLLRSGVMIPAVQSGDQSRIVVEAYPGFLARQLIGRTSYKSDNPKKQTEAQRHARRDLLDRLIIGLEASHGLRVKAPATLADDPTGDQLDALLCAVQAAWAWSMRRSGFGAPHDTDALEGWIADPGVCRLA